MGTLSTPVFTTNDQPTTPLMSQFTISEPSNAFFQWLTASVFALLLLVATAVPAQAQMEDGELPNVDISVQLQQSAQVISPDRPSNDDAVSGFNAARAGVNFSAQFSENVSGLLMLQSEPNDFGGLSSASQFQPQVDFMVMNLQVSEGLTVQAGTPVTGLFQFRGFSDGPDVQGNPLIGNSPADMITAGEGVKLIGSFDSFGFDLTINKGFGEVLSSPTGENTGLNYIGKFAYTGSDLLSVGAGVAFQSGKQGIVFASGDGEHYNLNDGAPISSRNTHAAFPNDGVIAQGNASITPSASFDVNLWGGIASGDGDASAGYGGIGAKADVSENFYLAGRFTIASDQSDGLADGADETLTRFQGGIGVTLYEKALLKVEGFTQSHGDTAITRPADMDGFAGVMTELSFSF